MKQPILFIDHATGLGGAERSLLLLMEQLNNAAWQPHLATVEGELAAAATQLNVPVHLIPMPRLRRSVSAIPNGWRTSKALAQVAGNINAAALHSNTVRATFFAAGAAKLARKPLVWHFRDFWLSEAAPSQLWLDATLKRLLCRTATQIIVNSQAVKGKLPCQEKITVVYNGIDVARFAVAGKKGLALRQQLGLPPQTAVIGMVGRLRPWKGQRTFLHMASAVHKVNPAAHFLIAGGNPFETEDDYAEELRALTRQLKLETAVSFLGQLDDVRPALAAMDVFVHPGEPEPFGLVNIEAMAMGKPVVAWAHGALPEIVQHQQTGVLVPYELHVQPTFSAAILDLISTPEKAKQMGEAGRKRVEALFDIRQTTACVASIYDQHIVP